MLHYPFRLIDFSILMQLVEITIKLVFACIINNFRLRVWSLRVFITTVSVYCVNSEFNGLIRSLLNYSWHTMMRDSSNVITGNGSCPSLFGPMKRQVSWDGRVSAESYQRRRLSGNSHRSSRSCWGSSSTAGACRLPSWSRVDMAWL